MRDLMLDRPLVEYHFVKRIATVAGLVSVVGGAYGVGIAAGDAATGAGLVIAVAAGGAVVVTVAGYAIWETRTLRLATQNADSLALQLVGKELALNRFATVDDLTGLYTRREFDQFVKIEFERFRRHRRPATILLVEIDEIAQIAGRIGALNKGLLLSELSAILKRLLRSIDLGCRYTDNTLAVLLLETNREQAAIVADRVREAVAKCEFLRTADGRPGWTVTQSVAAFELAARTSHGCLKTAEQALAEARAAGIDGIHICDAGEDEVLALAS